MADRFIFQPFRFGAQGVALTNDPDRHIRDKVEAVLFTRPGERVNNPSFGVGLTKEVFASLDDITLAAMQFRIAHGLSRDLGQEVEIDEVSLEADPDNGALILNLTFRRRTDLQPHNLEIEL